jgi:hypothetical protein
VSAWLNVSLDPIQGTDQSKSTYWSKIYQYFHRNKMFDSDRSQVSLMNCWYDIQHDVNVFCGCVSRIETRNQSGASIDDKVCQPSFTYSGNMHSVTRLLTLYENLQVVNACALFISDDKLHRNFPYMHCWKILKDQPNWLERRKHINAPKPPAKRQKTTAKPSTSADTLAITGDADGDVQTATGAQQRSRKEEREEDIMAMCKHGSDGVPCDKEERN